MRGDVNKRAIVLQQLSCIGGALARHRSALRTLCVATSDARAEKARATVPHATVRVEVVGAGDAYGIVTDGRAILLEVSKTPETLPLATQTFAQRIAGRWRRDLVFFAIAAVVIGLDQLTKSLIRSNLELGEVWSHSVGFVRIIHVVNSGAAFGILQGQTPFLIITSLFGLAAIVLYYVYPPMDHGLIRIALGMQLGGAIGNLIDRVRLGEVTDFVDVGRFPTFNVADASISTSIVVVLIFFMLQETDVKRPQPQLPPDAGTHAAADD